MQTAWLVSSSARALGWLLPLVQQARRAPQRAVRVEQPGDQRRDPGQRPLLILTPAVRHRTEVQRNPQPGQLALIEPARPAPARQRALAAGPPAPPPPVQTHVDYLQ
jgi:hypothetical protein